MLSLSRKQDYALTALGYLARNPGRSICAREIAQTQKLPLPLLMNILKSLQKQELLKSSRGSNGGYQLTSDLSQWALCDLMRALEGRAVAEPCGCEEILFGSRRSSGPVEELKHRLGQFLHDVLLSDLIGSNIIPSGIGA